MTLLRTSPAVDALTDPTPTGAKRLGRWLGGGPERAYAPGLDVELLRVKYGPERAYAPRLIEGTFTLPLGTRWSAYERHRNDCINRFVLQMEKRGFDVCGDRKIEVHPGLYPAVDVLTGLPVLDRREFIVRAWFRHRAPKTVRLELKPEWLAPVGAVPEGNGP